MSESLSLKWGTLKSWDFQEDGLAFESFKKLENLSVSAMLNKHDEQEKLIICEIIDNLDADTIYLDWDGIDVSKEEAKKYVMEYGI